MCAYVCAYVHVSVNEHAVRAFMYIQVYMYVCSYSVFMKALYYRISILTLYTHTTMGYKGLV